MGATALDRLVSAVRSTPRHVDPEARLIETRPGPGYQLADGARGRSAAARGTTPWG